MTSELSQEVNAIKETSEETHDLQDNLVDTSLKVTEDIEEKLTSDVNGSNELLQSTVINTETDKIDANITINIDIKNEESTAEKVEQTHIPHARKTEESTSTDSEVQTKSKHKIGNDLRTHLKETLPEVLEYIQYLERVIEKQIKKIIKWKNKVKKKHRKLKDCAIQTCQNVENEEQIGKEEPKVESNKNKNVEEPKSFIDDIKEAAEMVVQNTGFVYEETSGLYYDYNSGYYYNAEYGLYYDGNTGTYMKYNQDSQSYEFHSQVSTASQIGNIKNKEPNTRKSKRKSKQIQNKEPKRSKLPNDKPDSKDIEEGECSDSESGTGSEREKEGDSDSSDISKQWPPCMRIIVESSDNPKIKIGSLHIITCDGGSLGREGDHSITLPDINVSKHHLKFVYDKESGKYLAVDLGSRNGTLLDNKRMSPSKQESEPMVISHGSKIQIGSTILLCHIHDGSHTCGHCEPGLLQVKEADITVTKKMNRKSIADQHKSELMKLKKQCGLVGCVEEDSGKIATGYTDRAQHRRDTVGSQNPHEKTHVASVNEQISSDNKGFKLLSKMGWKEGQSLGKDGDGIKEPIKLVSNQGTTGIGAQNPELPVPSTDIKTRQNIWKKTQERFQKLPHQSDAFNDDSD